MMYKKSRIYFSEVQLKLNEFSEGSANFNKVAILKSEDFFFKRLVIKIQNFSRKLFSLKF